MNNHHRNLLGLLLSAAFLLAPLNGQADPPPIGAGIVTALQADQDVYTNQPATTWCPACTTNNPPCMLPCYYSAGETATAYLKFEVTNQYNNPRTFQFSSGQQFDIEIIDETGTVVAAWSDDKFFTQSLTTFTLQPGETKTFSADMLLQDRDGKQLDGTYQMRAFLTTSGPVPRVEATTKVEVTLGP